MRATRSSTLLLTLGALVLLAFAPAASAQECESGKRTSAAGTIIEIYPDAMNDAWYLFADVVIRSCDFEDLWLKEEPPKECAPGVSFLANGIITKGLEVTLDVEGILCIPK